MHDVFISYARADAETVDRIAAALEKLQVRIWLDRRDIPVSIPWFEEVRAAVEAADLMAICASPNWELSQSCQLERRAAEEGNKRLFPVDIRQRDPQAAA